ncbi:MAG: class I SAM-dependent methyltransferase [Longimicrobiales bacterium]
MVPPPEPTPRPCPICRSKASRPYPNPFELSLRTCRECGVRFLDEPPSERELARRYDEEHEAGKWAALFGEADPAERRRRAALLAELRPPGEGDRLLDVGCGDGGFLDEAAAAGWRPLGLEISTAAAAGVAHPVAVGPLDAIAPGAGLAVVTFWDVLEHVVDPAAMLEAAAERLAPGGLVAVTMPNAAGTEALLAGPAWRYHDVGVYGHLLHPTPRHVRALLEGAGLEAVHVETSGSVDLRDRVPAGIRGRALTWLLDRVSGVVARVAVPLHRGNTMLLVGRRA